MERSVCRNAKPATFLNNRIMKKYLVTITKTWAYQTEVEAANAKEAKKKGFAKYAAKKMRPKDHKIYVDKAI